MAKTVDFAIRIRNIDGKVLQNLTVEADGLDEIIAQIGETAARTGNQLREMAGKSIVLDASVRSIQQLNDMVQGLAEPFNSFEDAMRGANTMADKSGAEFDALSDSIVRMSKDIPIAREELANGLYQTISNGVPEDNWIEFLEQSAKAAKGGIADLGQTVTVTSTVLKNYGMNFDKAREIQDKMQTTAKNGVTSFEQLSQALPRVSGTAAQLGVTVDEMMSVFATTTGVTGNTAEVSTQLAAVLSSLVKPSTEATKAAEAMGIGFNASSIKAAGGLQNFLVGLDASVTEYAAKSGQLKETIYGQLFGSAEALRLLGSLTGEQKEKFAENIGAMAESAGATDQAYEEMASTGDSMNQVFKSQIQSMLDWAGSIASTAAPYVSFLANTGMAILSMAQLSTGVGSVVKYLKGLNAATLAHAAAAKIATVASNAWKICQTALNFVLSANPIGLVIIAIGALVAGIIAAYNNCESFRNICDQVWSVVKKVAAAVWDFLVAAFEKASAVIKKAWEWVKNFFGIKDEGTAQSVAKATGEIDKNTKATEANAKAQEEAAKKAQEALKANKKFNSPLPESENKDKDKDKYSGKNLIANASTYKELGNNIQYYQKKLETTKPTETALIEIYAKKITALQEQQSAIERMQLAASRPAELNTLKKIDAELAYQQSLRDMASQGQLGAIDAEIERLNELKTAFERSSYVPVGAENIRTYKQLDRELQHYSDLMKTATDEERGEIQKQINALNDLRKKWEDTLEATRMPEDIDRLDTMEMLDNALSYYQARQKKASAEEVADIQRTIIELQKKRNAMNRSIRLPEMDGEIADLGGKSGMELRAELKLIGVDGFKKRLKELKEMLNDVNNPIDDKQRAQVKKLIASYEDYNKVLKKNQVTFQKSYGSVKKIGGGIKSLTDTVEGNGTAWEKITGVIDAAIEIYEGISAVVSIIQALTGATQLHTATTESDTAATVASTAATAADTATAGTNIAVKSGEAIVNATAEGAKQSFPMNIVAIAAGVAAVIAAIAMIASFDSGGIVGGAVRTGDHVMARVESGEMILNATQQSRLWKMLNTPTAAFADGGIVYGPTLALMGEYANAVNNPEVIAPLNKLQELFGNDSQPNTRTKVKVKGRDIVLAVANETRISRRKPNIKL